MELKLDNYPISGGGADELDYLKRGGGDKGSRHQESSDPEWSYGLIVN